MASDYPGALDSFTAKTDDVDDVMAVDVNELQEAIVATQTELGTDPAGASATVKARLDALDTTVAAKAAKASNLSDLASASTARTNLGLGGAATLAVGTTTGTVAAGDDSRITGAAQKASNLSDLASASTARTNLGLGTAATISSTAGGDLSGTLPSPTVAKINGVAVTGTPSVGQVPTATSTSAATWQTPSGGSSVPLFGDGSDGNVTITTTVSLSRDMYYDTLTVTSPGILITTGYRVFAKTAISVGASAFIRSNGNNGAGSGGGTAPSSGTLQIGQAGKSGTTTSGTNGTAQANSLGGASGGGGTGTSGAGGTGTTPSAIAAASGSPRAISGPLGATTGYNSASANNIFVAGGAGGGGGGGNGTGNGGGGGAGGNTMVLCAKTITNSGTISALGGNGAQGDASGCAGGGGGGGGVVIVVTTSYTGTAPDVSGGSGGALNGAGTAGTAGSAGTVITLTP